MSNDRQSRVFQITPPGRGAVASLRIEGSKATIIVSRNFHSFGGASLADYPINRLVLGHFGAEQVVVRRCEDGAVEVHCHGGLAAVEQIKNWLLENGCQEASWQSWVSEVHNDPIQTAALEALTRARTERTAGILLDQYQGVLRQALDGIQKAVEDGKTDFARQSLRRLLDRVPLGNHLVQPWRVVLGGPVNAGKSSLINAIVGYGRSIVHATPGTTRDTVTTTTAVDGWPIDLSDTAGLHESQDPIERAGIELAQQRLDEADLVILVFDIHEPWSTADAALLQRWPNALLVFNKCDLPPSGGSRPAGLSVSAEQGQGLQDLLKSISTRLVPNPPIPGDPVPFHPSQAETLQHWMAKLALCE